MKIVCKKINEFLITRFQPKIMIIFCAFEAFCSDSLLDDNCRSCHLSDIRLALPGVVFEFSSLVDGKIFNTTSGNFELKGVFLAL